MVTQSSYLQDLNSLNTFIRNGVSGSAVSDTEIIKASFFSKFLPGRPSPEILSQKLQQIISAANLTYCPPENLNKHSIKTPENDLFTAVRSQGFIEQLNGFSDPTKSALRTHCHNAINNAFNDLKTMNMSLNAQIQNLQLENERLKSSSLTSTRESQEEASTAEASTAAPANITASPIAAPQTKNDALLA